MPAAGERAPRVATGTEVPGLDASSPEPLPFAPSLHIRSFLLQRAWGNILIYSTNGLASEWAAADELGGISRRYLNHRHEAAFGAHPVDAPLFVHEREARSVERTQHVRATFSRRHMLDEDFEVIPTPGHTSGATAYLWDGGRHRILFTGDTIYLDRGEWAAAVLGSSDRARYLESLELIRGLEFDLLVPWAASTGGPFYAHTDRDDAARRIDAIHDRVRAGGDR